MDEFEIMIAVGFGVLAGAIITKKWQLVRKVALDGLVIGLLIIVLAGGVLAVLGGLKGDYTHILSQWQLSPPDAPSGVRWDLMPPNVARWEDEIKQAASECGIHPALLAAIVNKESSGDPDAIGTAGEVGLVQLMPATAAEMGVANRSDPSQSLRGGACYLAKQIRYFDGNTELGIAGYNAGATRIKSGVMPESTRLYGLAVMANYKAWSSNDGSGGASEVTGCCIWPTVGGYVSQMPNAADHMAYDMAVVVGTKVVASHDGEVVKMSKLTTGYGWHIVIAGEDGVSSLYAHLSKFNVGLGHRVVQGQKIGETGNTGSSTGPHLHFEILRNGVRVDPAGVIGTLYND